MGRFKSDPEWLPVLRDQEEKLRFDVFTREAALDIGLRIVKLTKEKYGGNAAICIIEDDTVVFAYKMPGMSMESDWWIRRKLNVCRTAGVSSLRAYVEIECGLREETWKGREGAFVACGGCMPVLMRQGGTYAYIVVSGLEHYLDHQVIADAVAEHLGVTIGSVA